MGIVALFVADQHHPAIAQPGEPANDRLVVTEIAIPAERHEIAERLRHVITEMRAHRMPGNLGFLPGSQSLVGARQEVGALHLEPADLRADIDIAVLGGLAQLGNPGFERGDRLFELEVGNHANRASPSRP